MRRIILSLLSSSWVGFFIFFVIRARWRKFHSLAFFKHQLCLSKKWSDEVSHNSWLITVRDLQDIAGLSKVAKSCLKLIKMGQDFSDFQLSEADERVEVWRVRSKNSKTVINQMHQQTIIETLLQSFDKLLAKLDGLAPRFKVNRSVEGQVQCLQSPDVLLVQNFSLLLIEIPTNIDVWVKEMRAVLRVFDGVKH